MATSIAERQYTPGTYGPFTLTSGPLKTRAKVTFTRTAGNLGVTVVWPDGPCLSFDIERRVSGNTWERIERWTASGGGLPLQRDGVTPATTSLLFPKPEGVDVRVTATVLQTLTTAITLED